MKKRAKNKKNLDRIVYEIKTASGINHIDVTTVAELKLALANVLPIDTYGAQAVAHLAHHERVAIEGQSWSIRRVGILQFVPEQSAPSDTQPERTTGRVKPSVSDTTSEPSTWPKLL